MLLLRLCSVTMSLMSNGLLLGFKLPYVPVQNAELEFVLQTRGPDHIEEVLRTLRAAGLFATTHPY